MTVENVALPGSVALEAASGYWFDRFGIDVPLASLCNPEGVSELKAQALLAERQKFDPEYDTRLVRVSESKVEVRGTNKALAIGAMIGRKISNVLSDQGLEVIHYGFIDTVSIDYESRSDVSDSWRFAFVKGRQIEAFKKFHEDNLAKLDLVRCEHELVESSHELIENIRRSSTVQSGRAHVYDDNAYMIFANGDSSVSGIRLQGYADRTTALGHRYDDLPSCEVLDAAAYIEKLGLAECVITVLPHTFRSQQGRVKRLLSLVRDDLPIVTVFTGSGKNRSPIDSIKPWQESVRHIANLLKQELGGQADS